MKAEDYSRRQVEVSGWPISVETYRLDTVYHCTIYSVDPGARFARGEDPTKEATKQLTLEKATRYLAQTRRFTTA